MNDEGNAARKIRKLRASRDLWKQRSAEKQQEIRQLRVTVRDLSSSRENWKTRVKELEQQLQAAHEAHAAVGPGSWIFFGGLMDNQAMPRTAPDAHHLVQRLITLEELACAKGHVYPLLLVRLALTWACEAHTSYRGIALIFASLRGVVAAVGPCAETIRLWLLRVGLFLLRRPLPRCLDWVFLVDLTIQLGTHKCLVILGVPLSQLRRTGYSPDHHDVHVLSLHVLTRCNGTIVSGHLSTVSKRVGVPVQIVSDHGSDVLAGIRLFRQKNRHVVETYDITHGLAILLKNQLEPDPCWTSFVKACQSTRQQLQQAVGSFLQPPAWAAKRGSSIWRVTWGGPTICWPCSVVASKGPWRSSLVGAKPRPNNGLKRNWVGCEGTRAK